MHKSTCALLLVPLLACSSAMTASDAELSEASSSALSTDVSVLRTGNATQFVAQGGASAGNIGACGVPDGMMDTESYVALNVQNTPHEYGPGLRRPIPETNRAEIGLFDNGANCGRWIHVVDDARCIGTNDGAPYEPFCRGGGQNGGFRRFADTGAALDMIVSDSCQDGNAWCRDDPNHVDLHASALRQFTLNGQRVDLSTGWNNDRVTWSFEPAPHYQGDVRIAFAKNAFSMWPAIIIAHLRNGIHAILQQNANGSFDRIGPNGDEGQVFTLKPAATFRIKIVDANEAEVNGGKVYSFSLPSSCASRCQPWFTEVHYD